MAAEVIGGDEYACALLPGGGVHCSGALQAASGVSLGLVSITGGEQHACGIHQTGAVRCWGVNTHGRLLTPAGTDFRSVAPGTLHSCALRASGEIICWGHNANGQAEPPRGTGFRAVASARGAHRSCALGEDRSITCWGEEMETPPPAGTGWTALALTAGGGCAQDASRALTCWGVPDVDRIDGAGLSAFSTGRDFVCVIRDGRIECAGDVAAIGAPPEGSDFVQIGSGYTHVCALRGRGTVTCWGSMSTFPGLAQ